MNGYIQTLKQTFSGMFTQGDGISVKDIRLSKFVYFAAYAFELMLFNARGLFLPFGSDVGNISGWTIAQFLHGISSLVFMLLWKEKFKGLIKTAVAITVIGFVPFVFLPYGYLRLIFGTLFYIGLGGAVTSARCGFAFAVNNSERFIGMVIMFFSVTLFKFIGFMGFDGVIVTYILPFALLIGLCVCLLKFKEEDFCVKEQSDKKDETGIYWALAFFILYFSADGYRACLVSKSNEFYGLMCLGMLIAGIVLFVCLAVFKLGTRHLWNVFFIACIFFALFTGFAKNIGSEAPVYFFGGLVFVGWPLCIYTLGCAQRHFASYALMKKCTVIFVVLSPISTISSDFVSMLFPESFNIITMIYLIAVVMIFLMLSPYSFSRLFSSVWVKDISKKDMNYFEEAVEKADRFEEYNLTPRQKEIAVLLLAAKTRRQIAGELGISESTVKMHTSDLYKRLGINSKAELFKLFGLAENES